MTRKEFFQKAKGKKIRMLSWEDDAYFIPEEFGPDKFSGVSYNCYSAGRRGHDWFFVANPSEWEIIPKPKVTFFKYRGVKNDST